MSQIILDDVIISAPRRPRDFVRDEPARGPIRVLLRWTRRFVWNALAMIGLLTIVYYTCFDLTLVISGSMSPTLQGDGGHGSDWVLCERVSHWFREPRRWEVVSIETEDHMRIAKRIVGLPYESVAIRENQVVVNESPAQIPPALSGLKYFAVGNVFDGRSAPCAEGYYVLGDDSIDSYDSRYVGPFARESILNRAWLIVWPPSRIGWVNDD